MMSAPSGAPLGFLLRLAAGAHRRAVDGALAECKVTAPQFFVMTLLGNEPGLSTADLARRTGQRMPTLSAILANLRDRGLVEATPHRTHGRIRELALTTAGRALHEQCTRRALGVERELILGAQDDISAVRRWLLSVIDT